jgi:hypothetical protein
MNANKINEEGAEANGPGFKFIRKLLSDRRFDK